MSIEERIAALTEIIREIRAPLTAERESSRELRKELIERRREQLLANGHMTTTLKRLDSAPEK